MRLASVNAPADKGLKSVLTEDELTDLFMAEHP